MYDELDDEAVKPVDESVAAKKIFDESEFLREARARFDMAQTAESRNREKMIESLRFYLGGLGQWPELTVSERKHAKKPIITINRMPGFVNRILGEIRRNKPSIKISPVDSTGDPAKAKIIEGILRHIQSRSNAKHAYNRAALFQVICGYGVIKIITEYAHDDTFDQNILIKRIKNPFTVYLDPDAEEETKSDGEWAFESETIKSEAFKKKYPDANYQGFEDNFRGTELAAWYSESTIRIASYWCKKKEEKEIVLLENGIVLEVKPENLYAIANSFIVKKRKVLFDRVYNYKISGGDILEGAKEFPSRFIPLVPVYGEEINLEGETHYKGLVEDLKDPQRLYNYWRTTGVETLALQPKTPYKLTKKQIQGYENMWNAANSATLPYILYNADPDSPGSPQREQPPQTNIAFFQEAQICDGDMKAISGIYDASLGNKSNETSGVAIANRDKQSETTNFHYGDNLVTSIEQVGHIIVDMIPRVIDTEKMVRILGEDDKEQSVLVNSGELNSLTVGKYDIEVIVGPSYANARAEASENMVNLITAMPVVGEAAADIVVGKMDWDGADLIAERIKLVLPAAQMAAQIEQQQAQAPTAAPGQTGPGEDPEALLNDLLSSLPAELTG